MSGKLELSEENLLDIALALNGAAQPHGYRLSASASKEQARAAWKLIAPLVLEEAAKVCDQRAMGWTLIPGPDEGRLVRACAADEAKECGRAIRGLKP